MFELGHIPMPDGYGEALLPVADCKAHLRVLDDSEDELIAILRDAAIEYVERHCGVKLGPQTGLTWKADCLPSTPSAHVDLAVRPVTGITSIAWQDGDGAAVAGVLADFRFSEGGMLRPVVGGSWPSNIGGEVVVTFDAGYAADEAPRSLLSAVKLMLGHLYMNREAVIVGTISGEAPLGVAALCAPFRRVLI